MIKKIILISLICILILVLTVWIVWGNTALQLNSYSVKNKRVPDAFDGFRIAQVSDLHNDEMGKNNEKLLALLKQANPDIIALTGDLVDSRRTDIQKSLRFVKEAVKIAPCYYVTGNHESRLSKPVYSELENGLTSLGVTVLHDEERVLERDGARISLLGLDDPDFAKNRGVTDNTNAEYIRSLSTGERFTILFTHRPNSFENYVSAGVDLTLCGHVHGGQFRLPFLGGLFAPDQGFFPKYDAGSYEKNGLKMIISRGVGNSLFPFRMNNRPEVVLIELTTAR